MKADAVGDALKAFEAIETDRRLMPDTPVICRVDGRAFHTLTRGMRRPYDEHFMECMDVTTKVLVEQLRPLVGYVQSDEITLVWEKSQDFDGRIHKMTSITAGLASAVFSRQFACRFPLRSRDSNVPHFDSRIFQVPNLMKALEVLQWREDDATRNSVSMLAQAHFSQKELLGKNMSDMKIMLEAKGVVWGGEPARFKRGGYFRRVRYERTLTEEEIQKIPKTKRPPVGTSVIRSEVRAIDIDPLRSLPRTLAIRRLFIPDDSL